jgi:hypothetical protein
VSTSAVDTWRAVKIRTKNLTEVPNGFLPLIQVPPMIQNKTEILNLKSRKTQVPIGYLTLLFLKLIFFILNGKEGTVKCPLSIIFHLPDINVDGLIIGSILFMIC